MAGKFSITNFFNFTKRVLGQMSQQHHHHHKVTIHHWTPSELITKEIPFSTYEEAFEYGAKYNKENPGSTVKLYDHEERIICTFDQPHSYSYA